MPHRERKNIRLGTKVAIVLKQDQRTGKQTIGVVKELLTNSAFHPHWVKVRLINGQVGVFWAITLAFSLLAVASALLFKRGKWKLKIV